MLYAFTSATANNGSAFAGIGANTGFYNSAQGFAELIGRFLIIIPALAVAGSLARKQPVPASLGHVPDNGRLWVGLLVGVILIVGLLTFFPALALGPIVEHFMGNDGITLLEGREMQTTTRTRTRARCASCRAETRIPTRGLEPPPERTPETDEMKELAATRRSGKSVWTWALVRSAT